MYCNSSIINSRKSNSCETSYLAAEPPWGWRPASDTAIGGSRHSWWSTVKCHFFPQHDRTMMPGFVHMQSTKQPAMPFSHDSWHLNIFTKARLCIHIPSVRKTTSMTFTLFCIQTSCKNPTHLTRQANWEAVVRTPPSYPLINSAHMQNRLECELHSSHHVNPNCTLQLQCQERPAQQGSAVLLHHRTSPRGSAGHTSCNSDWRRA